MARPPTQREAVVAAIGEPVEPWIERLRTTGPRLTYPQIARLLLQQHDIALHPDTLRSWHSELRPSPEPANGGRGVA